MAECDYYEKQDHLFSSTDHWCNVSDTWVEISSQQAYDHCQRNLYSSCDRYKKYKGSSDCFITTLVCDVLGKDDSCEELQILRGFRDNVLQKDSKYEDVLTQYDIVGPLICCNMKHQEEFYELYETNRETIDRINQRKGIKSPEYFNLKQVCENLFNLSIKRICTLVEEGKTDDAVNNYIIMTELLMKAYGIDDSYKELITTDKTKTGHGNSNIYTKRLEK